MSRILESPHTFFDRCLEIVFKFDEDFKIGYLNPVDGQELQPSIQDPIGKKLSELGIIRDVVEEFESELKNVFTTGERSSYEIVSPGKDNEKYYEINLLPQRDASGTVRSVLAFGCDISDRKVLLTELATQKAYFEQLFINSPNATVLLDNNDRIIRVNKGFERVFGYTQKEAEGGTLNELIVPEEYHEQAVSFSQQVLDGGSITTDTVRKKKDGSLINVMIIGYPIISSAKQIGIYGIYQDITRQKQDEIALINSEKRFRAIFNKANDAIFLTRLNDEGESEEIVEVNEVTCKRLGYTRDALLQMSPYELVDSNDIPRMKSLMKYFREDEERTYEITHITRDGLRIPEEINSHLVRLNGEKVVLSIARDITERRKAEEQLNFLSFHDELTGLYNRRYLENEIKRLNESRNLPISIIMTDIDNLKVINDTYGHKKGDELIIRAANVLKSVTRKADIVARMGGDEFVLVLPGAGGAAASGICRRIQKQCEESTRQKGLEVSISAGFAVKENDNEDLDLILRKADRNMYKDKLKRKETAF